MGCAAVEVRFFRIEADGLQEALAEADIRQPPILELDEQRHVVERGAWTAATSHHTGGQQAHFEAQLAQQPGEQAV